MVALSSETIEQEHNTLLKTPTLKFKKDQPQILFFFFLNKKSVQWPPRPTRAPCAGTTRRTPGPTSALTGSPVPERKLCSRRKSRQPQILYAVKISFKNKIK